VQEFDAVLSDVVMPDGNGHELMRWIAVNRPEAATILMTGFDTGCERCAFSPRCKLLSKPFSFRCFPMVRSFIFGGKRKALPGVALQGLYLTSFPLSSSIKNTQLLPGSRYFHPQKAP
jgi:hypothetical protein